MECKHEGKRSKYDGVSLTRMEYEEAYKKGNRNFAGVHLSYTYLYRANFQGANLQGANLQGANLHGANLQRTDLSDANLSRAHLENAYLIDANLSGASLIDTNLEGAKLHGANLINANLSGANLFYANLLHAANLDNTTNLCGAQFRSAHGTLGPYNLSILPRRNEQTHRFQVEVIAFFSSVPKFPGDLLGIILDYLPFSEQDRANAKFLVGFQYHYRPSFFSISNKWGDSLIVLYRANNPQALAITYAQNGGTQTRLALEAMEILTPTHDEDDSESKKCSIM